MHLRMEERFRGLWGMQTAEMRAGHPSEMRQDYGAWKRLWGHGTPGGNRRGGESARWRRGLRILNGGTLVSRVQL